MSNTIALDTLDNLHPFTIFMVIVLLIVGVIVWRLIMLWAKSWEDD